MRERAHLAGGWLTAGPDGECFRVTVFIPYGTREAQAAGETAGAEAGGAFGDISGEEVRPALAAAGVLRPAGPAREAHDRG
jgi:hypothetical protein